MPIEHHHQSEPALCNRYKASPAASPVGKSAGTGFESCGEERRPVGLPAAETRYPGC